MNSKRKYDYLDDDGLFREKTGILLGREGMGLAIISALNYEISGWKSFILLRD